MQNLSSITGLLRRGVSQSLVLLFGLLLLAAAPAAFAQTGSVGIGTAAPDASAALDVSSASKGLLPPRLTQAQRDAIASPAAGLTLYNTTTGKLNTWNGTSWDAALSATEQPFQNPGVTFNYTGAVQTYTVPAGVTSLQVDAKGAAGGTGGGATFSVNVGRAGARVQATLSVIPGQVLQILVGAGGVFNPTGTVRSGGYNGGGAASFGGTGGGATDLRGSGGTLADRLLVAGGGGGGGYQGSPNSTLGGAGGTPNGGNGSITDGGGVTTTSGTGGTQAAGGSAGGGLGTGGDGGNIGGTSGGGGGGGGYYGGGGGTNSGGGGGSSWVTPTGSSATTFMLGASTGDGSLTLTPGGVYTAPNLDGSNFVNVPGWILNGSDVYRPAGRVGVGIGTTSAPAAKLTVQPATDAEMGLRVTNGVADGPAVSGNIVLQTLTGGNSGFAFLGFNGGNGAGTETRFATTKNRWRLGTDQRGTTDNFFLDTYDGTTSTSVLRATTSGNVGIGTSAAPAAKLDVVGNVRVGAPGTVGEILTNTTGTNNMLAVAYGKAGGNSTSTYGDSGNYGVGVGTGVYDISFPASSGLSGVNFANVAVNVSLFGTTPGFITYDGGVGYIRVRTFNTSGILSPNYYFSFSVFTP